MDAHSTIARARVPSAGASTADLARFAQGDIPPSEWYERLYRDARGSIEAVPWADARPNPMLVAWLNSEAPGLLRPGSRVAVVGCGLGDDVAELACRGYEARGFDVSPTAIDWARSRFPDLASSFCTADLLALPPSMQRRFDLVAEIYTLQSLPPTRRPAAAAAVASLARPHGMVLTICRARDQSEPLAIVQGPPWPLTAHELADALAACDMNPVRPVEEFEDDEQPPVRRLRALFAR